MWGWVLRKSVVFPRAGSGLWAENNRTTRNRSPALLRCVPRGAATTRGRGSEAVAQANRAGVWGMRGSRPRCIRQQWRKFPGHGNPLLLFSRAFSGIMRGFPYLPLAKTCVVVSSNFSRSSIPLTLTTSSLSEHTSKRELRECVLTILPSRRNISCQHSPGEQISRSRLADNFSGDLSPENGESEVLLRRC